MQGGVMKFKALINTLNKIKELYPHRRIDLFNGKDVLANGTIEQIEAEQVVICHAGEGEEYEEPFITIDLENVTKVVSYRQQGCVQFIKSERG